MLSINLCFRTSSHPAFSGVPSEEKYSLKLKRNFVLPPPSTFVF
jgi:hypothetical protein